jgi:hypothetical protein
MPQLGEVSQRDASKDNVPCPKACANVHCTGRSKKFVRVKAGSSVGKRDWEELEGKMICWSCYVTYRVTGKLEEQCANADCDHRIRKYHIIEVGCKAGDRDWSLYEGKRLCDRCYPQFCKHGTFLKSNEKPLTRRINESAAEHNKHSCNNEATSVGAKNAAHTPAIPKNTKSSKHENTNIDGKISFSSQESVIMSAHVRAANAYSRNKNVCANVHCTHVRKEFVTVSEGCTARGRDWREYENRKLCISCFSRYENTGSFMVKQPKGSSQSGSKSVPKTKHNTNMNHTERMHARSEHEKLPKHDDCGDVATHGETINLSQGRSRGMSLDDVDTRMALAPSEVCLKTINQGSSLLHGSSGMSRDDVDTHMALAPAEACRGNAHADLFTPTEELPLDLATDKDYCTITMTTNTNTHTSPTTTPANVREEGHQAHAHAQAITPIKEPPPHDNAADMPAARNTNTHTMMTTTTPANVRKERSTHGRQAQPHAAHAHAMTPSRHNHGPSKAQPPHNDAADMLAARNTNTHMTTTSPGNPQEEKPIHGHQPHTHAQAITPIKEPPPRDSPADMLAARNNNTHMTPTTTPANAQEEKPIHGRQPHAYVHTITPTKDPPPHDNVADMLAARPPHDNVADMLAVRPSFPGALKQEKKRKSQHLHACQNEGELGRNEDSNANKSSGKRLRHSHCHGDAEEAGHAYHMARTEFVSSHDPAVTVCASVQGPKRQ